MTALPDTTRSRAVLVGAGDYQVLSRLDAVHNNLPALAAALQDEQVWGLPPGNCAIVEDPVSATEALDPITEAAREATDTLLVYYAGHGLVDPRRGELHLAHVGSDPQRMYTAIQYGQVRDLLLDSRASRRIVILDCCYSGRALGQMGNPAEALAAEASAEGTYVLAAAAENKVAIAPPGERFTAFTGELLHVIEHGISGQGPLLDLDSIYRELLAVMRAKGLPNPQKRDRNTAGQLTLIRNQAYRRTLVMPGKVVLPAEGGRHLSAPGEQAVPEADLGSGALGASGASEKSESGTLASWMPRVLSVSPKASRSWRNKVKAVTGATPEPGTRDQEEADRARARLALKSPRLILMLGCTMGAGQTVTTVMTGRILASIREEPVAAVDLHDGTLSRYVAPKASLDDILAGKLLLPLSVPAARLDVIASRNPRKDGYEVMLAAEMARRYSLTVLDPGATGLMKLLKIADKLVLVVPASAEAAVALADTRDWMDAHGFEELALRSVTVMNGVSRRSLPDVQQAESVVRNRCQAIVRIPWDDTVALGAPAAAPATAAELPALPPETRRGYTALAGALVGGLAALSVVRETSPSRVHPDKSDLVYEGWRKVAYLTVLVSPLVIPSHLHWGGRVRGK